MTRSILIVEDNPSDRQRLEKLLTEAGYLVATAVDGSQAVARATRSRPDPTPRGVNKPEEEGWATTRP